MASNDGAKIAFWIIISVAILVIVIAIIIIIIAVILISKYRGAIEGAIFNQNSCSLDPQRCKYFNLNLPSPTEFPDEFSKDLAIFCGQQVLSLEYFYQNKTLNIPESLQLLGTIRTIEKTAPLFAYVALDKTNKTLYVIMRGTLTEEEWLIDFTIRQNLLQEKQDHYFLKQFTNDNWNCSPDTLVHTGFSVLFAQIQPRLKQLILGNISCVDRIIVSGHSLGAAVSSLSAAYISSNLTTKPVFVYTFGKPRVGNISYANCIDLHFTNRFWRIENESDIVCNIPLSAMPNTSNYNQPWIYQVFFFEEFFFLNIL